MNTKQLVSAASGLIEYRDRVGPLGFQLEKADHWLALIRTAMAEEPTQPDRVDYLVMFDYDRGIGMRSELPAKRWQVLRQKHYGRMACPPHAIDPDFETEAEALVEAARLRGATERTTR